MKKPWRSPETAPKDGTAILADFGWPWPVYAVWDEYDEQWIAATVQRCEMRDGPDNTWLEMETERPQDLKKWMPLPKL